MACATFAADRPSPTASTTTSEFARRCHVLRGDSRRIDAEMRRSSRPTSPSSASSCRRRGPRPTWPSTLPADLHGPRRGRGGDGDNSDDAVADELAAGRRWAARRSASTATPWTQDAVRSARPVDRPARPPSLMRAGTYFRAARRTRCCSTSTAPPGRATRLKEQSHRLGGPEAHHRRPGVELDLFSFPTRVGSGLMVCFHPKGGIVRRLMEDSRQRHEDAGYDLCFPHITKGERSTLRSPRVVRGRHVPPMELTRAPAERASFYPP